MKKKSLIYGNEFVSASTSDLWIFIFSTPGISILLSASPIFKKYWIIFLIKSSDTTGDQAFGESQNLLDQLSLPIKNAFGRDVTPDNRNRMLHVEQLTNELQDRKSSFDELADVRRLKLEQVLQLRICDQDTGKVKIFLINLFLKGEISKMLCFTRICLHFCSFLPVFF